MNPITKKIKEREEEFENEWKVVFQFLDDSEPFFDKRTSIKSHISTTNKQLLESVIEMVERMENRNASISEYYSGYNQALQDIITQLKEVLKEIKI